MIKILFLLLFTLIFIGCDDSKSQKNLNAKELLQKKCTSCHDINMPPVLSDDEKAPPMMAVAFHVHNFVKPSDESQRTSKAISFVVDYVQEPSLEKSFCDPQSLERYGLMPSQKNLLTPDEATAIAEYMFLHFTQKNLLKVQQKIKLYNSLDKGEKIALHYKCLGCHKRDKKIVGPSFNDIAIKYKKNQKTMKESIRHGSKKMWKSSNGAVMPSFKKISDEELEILVQWILKS